jgi:serine/threonine protein kinase
MSHTHGAEPDCRSPAPASILVFRDNDDGTPQVWRDGDVVRKEFREWVVGSEVKEEEALSLLRGHPHVIPLLSTSPLPVPPGRRGRAVVLTFPYMPLGDAWAYVEKRGAPPEERVLWRWAYNIASALTGAQSFRILHDDVRPQNFLVSNGGKDLLLSDFGNAVILCTPTSRVYSALPIPDYIPPEAEGGGKVGLAADVWKMGVAFVEILTLATVRAWLLDPRRARAREDVEGVLRAIQPFASAEFCAFIARCLQPEHTRWSALKAMLYCRTQLTRLESE